MYILTEHVFKSQFSRPFHNQSFKKGLLRNKRSTCRYSTDFYSFYLHHDLTPGDHTYIKFLGNQLFVLFDVNFAVLFKFYSNY